MAKQTKRSSRKWYAMDLHLHTPSSSDYHQPDISYLDILKRAEGRGLDLIAFTDHNTVAGYRRMLEEIEQLNLLKELNRMLPEEEARLKEYKRLLGKIQVLPGFEFTATFGFHVLGIFPSEKPVREIEHILLQLNIPADQLDVGSVTVGASSDVMAAYRMINEAGGLVIAAHANSSNGVAMRGFPFGGQTKIAYTQDPNLHALEVTDLEKRGRYTTAHFFRGTKPEYPRRMHCIQGSDAHQLDGEGGQNKNLGVGERVTEVLLPEPTFKELKDLFLSNDFARTRPRPQRKGEPDFDFIHLAREEGANLLQDFHESITVRGGNLYAIIADVCAFANTNGGSIYVGISKDTAKPVTGIKNPTQAIRQLEKEISTKISPPLTCTVDTQKTGGQTVIRILVPHGEDPPYAVDDNKIYIREEGETGLAVRDEIVGLAQRGKRAKKFAGQEPVSLVSKTDVAPDVVTKEARQPKKSKQTTDAPRTGVEVVRWVERNGVKYYSLRDLRNGNVVKNVTEKSARRLWHYAITAYSKIPADVKKAKFTWQGNLGVMRSYKQGNRQVYDLIRKDGSSYQYFYGVTEDGVHGAWQKLVGIEENSH